MALHSTRSAVLAAAAAAVAVALSACATGGGDGDRRAEERPAGAQRRALAERREAVQFHSRDGVLLSGSLTLRRRGAPVVVLVHQFGSDRHDWDGLVLALDRAGYATLAYDTRGMGRSLSRWPSKTRYHPPRDEGRYLDSMPRDVAAAVQFLRARRDVDGGRVAVIGASFGANVAYASSAVRRVRAAVALSPVLLSDALRPKRRSPRAVLFISSRAEAGAVLDLAGDSRRPKRTVLAESPEAHGVALLREGGVRRAILDWLRRHLAT